MAEASGCEHEWVRYNCNKWCSKCGAESLANTKELDLIAAQQARIEELERLMKPLVGYEGVWLLCSSCRGQGPICKRHNKEWNDAVIAGYEALSAGKGKG